LWTDAYLGDTTHLTTIEHGAYFLLLMTAWRSKDTRLPDDDRLLARYARCNAGQWKRLRPILEPFFSIENGFWTQGRLTDEAVAVRQKREAAAANGRASALKRKGRHSAKREQSDNGATNERSTDGQLNHNHSSVTNVTGVPPDPAKLLFDAGVKLLTDAGTAEKQARALLGKWRQQSGDDEVRLAVAEATIGNISDPVSWITARLQSKPKVETKRPGEPGSMLAHIMREKQRIEALNSTTGAQA
jgi:uncharacterized protein YdaU (DUF1376 family)